MTAMEAGSKKKAASKKAEDALSTTAQPELHVVEPEKKPKIAPGEPGFDWQTEYPDEQIYIYTVPEGTKQGRNGMRSPPGLTIGLAKLIEDRAPNPGMMQEASEIGGFEPMWLFINCVASPEAKALMKLLRPTEYNELLRGWAKFAGIELSE